MTKPKTELRKTYKKPGPKLLQIDETLVYELAKIHCTMGEIAAVVGCSVDTLERRYAETIKKGDEEGKMSLKRKMHQMALNGNTVMLVWLSKQRLGYRDKQPDEATSVQFNIVTKEVPKEIIDVQTEDVPIKEADEIPKT